MIRKFANTAARSCLGLFILAAAAGVLTAQSSDQNFPTPVRVNEINGTIKARDVGDPRLTVHFYTFEGAQGDLFVNIQTSNFSGDVDVYAMPGLRPLTKMVMYSGSAASETGRVIYLRKPETLLLRVEGRSPGDEDAGYKIKFAGGFVASSLNDPENAAPSVSESSRSGIRVNSVGTILDPPSRTPLPATTPRDEPSDTRAAASAQVDPDSESDRISVPVPASPERAKGSPSNADPAKTASTKTVDRSRPAKRNDNRNTPPEPAERRNRTAIPDTSERAAVSVPSSTKPVEGGGRQGRNRDEKEVDPMASIRLVVRFKDGGTIERPMSEVLKFTVERAVLTIISKNGAIGRFQMTEVAAVTIE